MEQKQNTQDNARALAIEVLQRFAKANAPLDELLAERLSASELSRLDKALVHELVYGVVRRRLTLDHYINSYVKQQAPHPLIMDILRLALYQYMFLDRIPDHAIVNEAVTLVHRFRRKSAAGFVNAVLRRVTREKPKLPVCLDDSVDQLSVNLSFPLWLVHLYLERFGHAQAAALLAAGNERPDIYLRVNTRKQSAREAKTALKDGDVWCRFVPGMSDALVVDKGASNLGACRALQQGLVYAQDLSSQLAVKLVGAQPGERVLDACAAPGGKTAGLWEMMEGRGELVAVENSVSRVRILKENLQRLGVEARVETADIRKFEDDTGYDAVLLDVPCSGTGVMQRHPELRWRLKAEEIKRLVALQAELLAAGARLVKPGGRLIYSTCSVLPEENEELVREFSKKDKRFKLEAAGPFLPQAYQAAVTEEGYFKADPTTHGMDGFFAARLVLQA